MRQELQNIEQIENYLLDKLSPEEKKQFEVQISTDKKLALEVEIQKIMMQRVKRILIKNEINMAHKLFVRSYRFSFRNNTFRMWLAGGFVSLVLSIGILNLSNKKEISQDIIISELSDTIKSALNTTSAKIVLIEEERELKKENDSITDVTKYSSLTDIFGDEIQNESFNINYKKGGIIKCTKGTKIYFPPEAFDLPATSVKNPEIDIEAYEFTSTNDMILAGLSTTSNGHLLETVGMINLNAFYNGKKVALKKNKKYQVVFNFYRTVFMVSRTQRPRILLRDGTELIFNNMVAYNGTMRNTGIDWSVDPAIDSLRVGLITSSTKGFARTRLLRIINQDTTLIDSLAKTNFFIVFMFEGFDLSRDEWRNQMASGDCSFGFTMRPMGNQIYIDKVKGELHPLVRKKIEMYIGRYSKFKTFNAADIEFSCDLDVDVDSTILARIDQSLFDNAIYDAIYASKLGWINCDRFINSGEIMISASFDKLSNEGTHFIIFHDSNSILSGNNSKTNKSDFSIPKGKIVTVIGIDKKDKKNYFFKQTLKITENIHWGNNLFTQMDKDSILNNIRLLDNATKY